MYDGKKAHVNLNSFNTWNMKMIDMIFLFDLKNMMAKTRSVHKLFNISMVNGLNSPDDSISWVFDGNQKILNRKDDFFTLIKEKVRLFFSWDIKCHVPIFYFVPFSKSQLIPWNYQRYVNGILLHVNLR